MDLTDAEKHQRKLERYREARRRQKAKDPAVFNAKAAARWKRCWDNDPLFRERARESSRRVSARRYAEQVRLKGEEKARIAKEQEELEASLASNGSPTATSA